MNIYFLGPKGTYSEQAAKTVLKILAKNDTLVPVSTISKVIQSVNETDSCAVVPYENSIEGIVRQTIDNIYRTDVKIQAEIDVKIEHCFASKAGEFNQIKKIFSHPQALAQCSDFITQNFNEKIELISSSSTAEAVNMVLENNEYCGAIASSALAQESNLNILAKNIGNIKENKTRFVLISKEKMNLGENKKTTIVFNTKNESGALLKVLEIFNKYNLNLTYIESRPSKEVFGEYNFFADIDKPYEEVKEAISEIKEKCNFYKLLGSYCILNI